ncbi:MAG: hypothetical protein LIP02_02235 [Bacteroidales bacterium]|nr:hypothetical protein [Bacteroidales bacterium]
MKTVNNIIRRGAIALVALAAAAFTANAEETPLIELHSNIYDTYGSTNAFTLLLGGNNGGTIQVDCGYGKVSYTVEPAVYDSDAGEISGMSIPCSVTADGYVRIYGDDGALDYFNGDGCYISTITFRDPASYDILSLSHNELEQLDLSEFTNLQALYINDNEFSVAPLKVGANKPNLRILNISIVDNLDPSFNLSDYPQMLTFTAQICPTLTSLDPSGCPLLVQLSIDCTNVSTLDVSHNPQLYILNISDTGITSIDLTNNPNLQELYCTHESGTYNSGVKLTSLDVSHNPGLFYLFASGNALTNIDLSNNTYLNHCWLNKNLLTDIDLSNCPNLMSVRLENNYFTFATLPIDPGSWNEYEYKQYPMQVPASYLVGTEIDLSDKVLREGGETYAALYYVDPTDPNNPVELDESYYTYSNGKITINQVVTDSVYVDFACSLFPESSIRTSYFKVKDSSTYGQPDQKMQFLPACYDGDPMSFLVAIDGATPTEPKKFYVDLGDGTMQEFTATGSTLATATTVGPTRKGYGYVKVYTEEGGVVTAISTAGLQLYSADVTAMPQLRELDMSGCGLYTLDTQWNRCLTYLNLSNNNFYNLDLAGNNENYGKNVLVTLDLSNNNLSSFDINTCSAAQYLNLSNNQYTELTFDDYIRCLELNVSGNQLTELDLSGCDNVQKIDASNNLLTSYTCPSEDFNVVELNLAGNAMTLENLPAPSEATLTGGVYTYAPQEPISITAKAPGVDLSSQNVTIDGSMTVYTWKTLDGETMVAGTDYTESAGSFKFLEPMIGKTVKCYMTNAAMPQLAGDNALATTAIEASLMPTNVLASFVTTTAGETVTLSLASHTAGDAIYIDWNGDGTNLVQYTLGTSYTLFSATTKKGVEVKVYSYADEGNLSVFSISGASMSSFDASAMNNLVCLSVMNAGLDDIILPDNLDTITELTLSGNNFSDFNLGIFPNLQHCSLASNPITSLDLRSNTSLQTFSATSCAITSVNLEGCDKIWALYLADNDIEEIDVTPCTNLQQLTLQYNRLSHIDLTGLNNLMLLYINNNRFDFNTLPLPQWTMYAYANQDPIDPIIDRNVVDLSSQASVTDGETTYETVYTWYVDTPVWDEDDNMLGENLYVDDEYTIEGGVSTFNYSFDGIMCVMTNAAFPDCFMYTNLINVDASGVGSILNDPADANAPVEWYNLQGVRLSEPTRGEILIRCQGSTSTKVILK